MDQVIEGAVIAAILGKQSGIEKRMVEAGIKDRSLVIRRTINRDKTKLLVPGLSQCRANPFEVPIRNLFLKIGARLLDADERRSDAHLHNLFPAKRSQLGLGEHRFQH